MKKIMDDNLEKDLGQEGVRFLMASRQRAIQASIDFEIDAFSVFIAELYRLQQTGATEIELFGGTSVRNPGSGWRFSMAHATYPGSKLKVNLMSDSPLILILTNGIERETMLGQFFKPMPKLILGEMDTDNLIEEYAKTIAYHFPLDTLGKNIAQIIRVNIEKIKLNINIKPVAVGADEGRVAPKI